MRDKVYFSENTQYTLRGGGLENLSGDYLRLDLDPHITERDFGQPIGAMG